MKIRLGGNLDGIKKGIAIQNSHKEKAIDIEIAKARIKELEIEAKNKIK